MASWLEFVALRQVTWHSPYQENLGGLELAKSIPKILDLIKFGLCFALWCGTAVFAAPPPSSGDWTVADTAIVENQTIALNGKLSVVAGGSLTLQTVTLDINCTFNGEFGIEVAPGGSLYIYDSEIKAGS